MAAHLLLAAQLLTAGLCLVLLVAVAVLLWDRWR